VRKVPAWTRISWLSAVTAIVADPVAGLQGAAQIRDVDAVAGQAPGVEQDPHHLVGHPQGVDVPGAGDALDLLLDGVGHLAQLEGPDRRVLRPQGGGDDGHVVDALGLDDGVPTPRLGGSQSWLEKTLLKSRTMASVRPRPPCTGP
jgi:hypothetical protein